MGEVDAADAVDGRMMHRSSIIAMIRMSVIIVTTMIPVGVVGMVMMHGRPWWQGWMMDSGSRR
jgi:hypothetical protein